MSKELIVSTGKHETRVAILEDDQLVEIFHEREKEYSLAGSIHKGRVTRVLPGMQSAFVDIGLDRDAFLYVSDFFEDNEEYDAVVSTVEEKVLKMEKGAGAERYEAAKPAVEIVAPERAGTGPVDTPPASDRRSEIPREAPREASPEIAAEPTAERGERGPDRGGDRGSDRDRRGRRGRRRRGGRGGSGLPDSKYFSPRNEASAENPVAAGAEEEVAAAPERNPSTADDFMVLPGESLAKYSAPDGREDDPGDDFSPEDESDTNTESAPEVRGITADEYFADAKQSARSTSEEGIHHSASVPHAEGAHETHTPLAATLPVEETSKTSEAPHHVSAGIEPALPAEHPLAGLGATQPWSDSAASETPEVTEKETETDGPSLEAEDETYPELPGESSEAPEEASDEAADQIAPVVEDEGPEPARIPTSLTATLREQGHRYPHRASRRMRRKMRGQSPEDREKQDSTSAEPRPATETRGVEVRDDRRTDQRQDRGPRERGDRERGDKDKDRGDKDRGEKDRGEKDRGDKDRAEKERPERERPPLPSISDLLKEGQEIIVQIAKEPLGQKGARITSHIALPGRFVVYMPTVDHAGVSRKIPSDEERQRLKRIVQTHRQGIPGGFICRTAAENKSEEELKSDMLFLYNLWLDMRHKAEKRVAPMLLHHDLDLVQRILRDQLTTSFKTIWVDGEELYESILSFAQRFQPALVGRVKLYTRTNPVFDEFGITNELEKALRPKVWLKSGGYIVINQTEALVAIDINTGKYVGKSNRLEDTIVKINTDAIKEIVRQIRLRDLGGIIVVDFIDMDERKNRQKVMQALEETMRADRAPYKILQFNDFGLVAITRKRVKQSLERTLCAPCPYCEGAGYVKSVQTVIGEILQEAQRMQKSLQDQNNNVVLRVNPEVGRVLKSNHNQFLQEIEEILGKSVLVKSDPLLHQTKFDLA
jgi:ribonuclease G